MMKRCLAFSMLLSVVCSYAQHPPALLPDPGSILIRVSQKLNSLSNIRFDQLRELNYSSENYHNVSAWTVYNDFQSNDTITGFKYQVADTASLDIFNGTEKFGLNYKQKSISVEDHPTSGTFSALSALYNSMVTLKNVLPLLIADKTPVSVHDTIIRQTSYTVITLNTGKRRIQNLGLGFDAMTTRSNFIYTIVVDNNTFLPLDIVQSNDLNGDFIRTSFTKMDTNPAPPSEISWYYSTYLNDYALAGQRSDVQLVSTGTPAPDWTLRMTNGDKTVSLHDLKGEVVLLDFWIKNCGPCIQSVPHLNDLQEKFRSKHFRLLSINAYDSEEDVNWFCNKHKTNYPVLLNGKEAAEKYGVSGYPVFFILDKTGRVIYSGAGYSNAARLQMEKIIAAAL